jgi:hypothetical protein
MPKLVQHGRREFELTVISARPGCLASRYLEPRCPTLVAASGLLARLFQAMGHHVLEMLLCPTVRQQTLQ